MGQGMPVERLRDLGFAIRDARRAGGLTQAQVAERAGVTRYWVTNLELGKGNPTLSSLLAVLRAVGLSISLVSADAAPVARPVRELPEPVDLDQVLARTTRS